MNWRMDSSFPLAAPDAFRASLRDNLSIAGYDSKDYIDREGVKWLSVSEHCTHYPLLEDSRDAFDACFNDAILPYIAAELDFC
jgi:hypothetical protein